MWKDLLIIGWFAALALMILGFRAYTRKSARQIPESATKSAPEVSYVGGLTWTRKRGFGSGSGSRGTGNLSVFEWGLRFAPSSVLLRPFVPTVELRFGEIESVSVGTSQAAFTTCVEFRAPKPDFYLVFWTSQWAAICDVLQAHGVNVNRTPSPFRTLSWPDR